MYFPTYSNGLKEVCNYLGFNWESKIKSGLETIIKRKEWEISMDKNLRNELILYNKNDCEALLFLINTIKLIHENNNVDLVKSIKKIGSYKWQDPDDYFQADYKLINKLSYFNYNQEKIYFRSNVKSRVAKRDKIKARKSIEYRPNEFVEVYPKCCPQCKTHAKKHLSNRVKLVKRKVIDLKFMQNGIKRWIFQFNGGLVKCGVCSHIFSPSNVFHIKMFGDHLKNWCVNQHISYHMSFNSIAASLEIFNININKIRVFEFKHEVAKRYNLTYELLKNQLVNGGVLNVDETEVKIKEINKGYVWVFASMDTVIYHYRQSREATFLKDFLASFTGVLVSDFYSGYDNLPCQQQKCLVHLIRDLNSDFYKNQLDLELKLIVTDFGKLLKEIVETIDKYGLKKRNLNKYLKRVETFYKTVISKEFKSELAYKYQNRFIKYKKKLFVFLENENIPWHNNNAEYAIKSFAKHREKGNRVFTEASIQDYMILLSIEQTCKYRGIRFMDFLMKPDLLK
ncbi:transposase [Mucilaginibacter sp. AW1-7]|uniref:IS66 family transposase n=1 Tax=Mucilaginibacter sp. AW1-7 TaxID=3349874 RepID=UPI003F73CC59